MNERKLDYQDIIVRNVFVALIVAIVGGLTVAYFTGNFHPPTLGPTSTTIVPATTTPSQTPINTVTPSVLSSPIDTPTPYPTPTEVFSSICDDFVNSQLNSGWEWIDPKKDSSFNFSDKPGFIRIIVNGKDHDLYQNLNAPRLLQNVEGDFSVTTKLTIFPRKNYQGAGLLFWQNNDNYVRIERTLVKGIDLLYRIRGEYKAIEVPFYSSEVFLKLEIINNRLKASYSENGNSWESFDQIQIFPNKINQIGIVVVNEWQNDSISADFDYFKFSQCH